MMAKPARLIEEARPTRSRPAGAIESEAREGVFVFSVFVVVFVVFFVSCYFGATAFPERSGGFGRPTRNEKNSLQTPRRKREKQTRTMSESERGRG